MSPNYQLRRHILSTHCVNIRLFNKFRFPLSAIYTCKRRFIRRYLAFHTSQISSFGGSATTALSNFLEQKGVGLPKITEWDWAPWKHMRCPPRDHTVQKGFRALYVVADPRDAMLSVFRRGYQHWHIQRLEGDVASWNFSWDLEQFLSCGHDHFRLREHLDNWIKARRGYPIMIIKYEALWEQLPAVFEFFDAPPARVEESPRRTRRKTNWKSEAKEIIEALNRIYGDLAEDIATMADVNILLPEKSHGQDDR